MHKMRNILITQGWNFILIVFGVLFGWYFSYEVGSFLSFLFGSEGNWTDPTAAVGVIFGIPSLTALLLSFLGMRGWYWWAIVIFLPLFWLTLNSGDVGAWIFFGILITISSVIGLGARTLLKRFFPSLFIFQ